MVVPAMRASMASSRAAGLGFQAVRGERFESPGESPVLLRAIAGMGTGETLARPRALDPDLRRAFMPS